MYYIIRRESLKSMMYYIIRHESLKSMIYYIIYDMEIVKAFAENKLNTEIIIKGRIRTSWLEQSAWG